MSHSTCVCVCFSMRPQTEAQSLHGLSFIGRLTYMLKGARYPALGFFFFFFFFYLFIYLFISILLFVFLFIFFIFFLFLFFFWKTAA